jgi:uncharacterized protein (TIGR03437 family)
MRCGIAWLLVLPCAFAANHATYTYTLPVDARVAAIAVDKAGNTYLTGSTGSSTFPTTPDALQTTFGGGTCDVFVTPGGVGFYPCTDAFVVKLDPYGNTIFSTYVGGEGSQTVASAICVDADGNLFIGGSTYPNSRNRAPNSFPVLPYTFPITAGAAFTNPATSGAFVVKLNAAGNQVVYGTLLPINPQNADFHALGLALDSAGNAYIASTTRDLPDYPFPATPGAFQNTTKNQNVAGIVMKLNPTGTELMYATYLSGNLWDVPQSIAVDAAGNAFIAGYTQSKDFPVTAGAYQTTSLSPNYTGFLTKLNPQGSGLVYSTLLGASGNSGPWVVKVDAQGGAWVLGVGNATSAIGTAFRTQPNQSTLFHLSADGSSLKYSTGLPQATGLDLDSVGNVYVAGCTGNSGNGCTGDSTIPTGPAAFQRAYAGAGDGYAARFDPFGALTGATYLGGSQSDVANFIAVAPNGSVVIAGTTLSSDFPGIAPPVPSGPSGGAPFVAGMFMDLTVLNAASFVPGVVSPGEIVAIKGYQLGPEIGQQGAVAPTASSECVAGQPICFGGTNGQGGFGAPVFYAQNEQINVQVPWELAGEASTQIFVTPSFVFEPNPISPPLGPFYGVPIAASVPGILSIDNSDGTRNSPSNPAKPGDFVTIYGTGGGIASATGVTGGSWPLTTPEPTLTQRTSVSIGGMAANVLYAGVSPLNASGVFQINVRVPADLSPSATASMELTIGDGSCPPVPVAVGTR